MRLGGFASGMDINQMVKDLMTAERMPMDRMKQSQQVIQWRMDEYRSINRSLDSFRTSIFDSVLLKSNMMKNKATTTNSTLVTASASANATDGSFNLSKVSSLATAASAASSDSIASGNSKIDQTKSLQSQAFADDAFWRKGIVNRKEITVSEAQTNLNLNTEMGNPTSVVVKVNGASYKVVEQFDDQIVAQQVMLSEDGNLLFKNPLPEATNIEVTATYANASQTKTIDVTEENKNASLGHKGIALDSLTVSNGGNAMTIVTDATKTLTANEVYVNADSGAMRFSADFTGSAEASYQQNFTSSEMTTFNANGQAQTAHFVFTGEKTMANVVTEMNQSPIGVNVFFDEFSNKISVMRAETGNFNKDGQDIQFNGGANDFFKTGLKLGDPAFSRDGVNAKFTVNGLETERNTNTFTMNGVTMTLQGTFEAGVNGASAVTIGTSRDTDSVFDTIKKFVDEYNELIDLVNGKTKEEAFRDYRPLTDEQRREMSDTEIERWEEKAMSGMLRNDSILRAGMSTLRTNMYTPVNTGIESAFNQLTQIGISTSSNYMDGGKLVIDETKLRQAITTDAEGVYQLFAADGPTNADKGLARRVRESAATLIDRVSERAGGMRGRNLNHQFTLGRELNQIDTRISNFERKLKQIEDRYWKQFTAMEKAMSTANSQSDAIYSFMYGGQ